MYKLHRLNKKAEIKKHTIKQLDRIEELKKQQTKLHNRLEIKEFERTNTEKKVSKIDELIAQKKQKSATNNKLLMDVIKIIARNIFYLTFSKYRKLYNDKRDDLFIFRELSRSSGIIKHMDDKIIFELAPQMEIKNKAITVINNLIDNINQTKPELPNNSRIFFSLKLAESVDHIFAFDSCTKRKIS